MITIAYINFWNQSLNMTQDFWLSEFIKYNIESNIQLIAHNKNPDILIASCFGNINIIKNINAKIKLFFYGENLNRFPPYNDHELLKKTFDFIIGFKNTNLNEKLIRLPLWLTYYPFYNYTEEFNILKYLQESYTKYINETEKENNASLVSRHDRNGIRTIIYDELSKYIKILCPGSFKHNIENIGLHNKDKINFISKTTYNICPENSEFEGYCTEKIFQALEAGCIPIYWAIDKPEKEIINENCYCWIDTDDKNNFDKTNFKNKIKNVIENKTNFKKENIFTTQSKYVVDDMYKTLKNQIKLKLELTNKQKIYGISYASRQFINRYEPITKQAININLFNDFKCWKEEDIEDEFKNKNYNVWNDSTRGGGWWIWKSYIIYKQLEIMNDDDILVYIDSGCKINNTTESKNRFCEYIEMLNNHWSGLLRFQLTHPEYKYTNNYTINYFKNKFDVNMDEHIKSNQILGGLILIRKNKFSLLYFQKILEIINEDPFLFTEKYTNKGEIHRHDQSIMSLLCKVMNCSLIIPDETYFEKGFGCELAKKCPFWATRLK